MNIRQTLSERITLEDIRKLIRFSLDHNPSQKKLLNLLFDPDEKVSYQAGWVLSHWPIEKSAWLIKEQNRLINALFNIQHDGKKRVILTILYRQPLSEMDRVDFLDFCLEGLVSNNEAIAIRSLCMKIAYELCRPFPELLEELKAALDMIEDGAPPAIAGARYNILKAMTQGKSLQSKV